MSVDFQSNGQSIPYTWSSFGQRQKETLLTDTFAINNNILMALKAKPFSGVQGVGERKKEEKKKSVLETIVM